MSIVSQIQQEILDLLRKNQERSPGKFIFIGRNLLPSKKSSQVDLRTFIDTPMAKAMNQMDYQYIASKSDCDNIVVIDTSEMIVEYDNCIEYVRHFYNSSTDKIEKQTMRSVSNVANDNRIDCK